MLNRTEKAAKDWLIKEKKYKDSDIFINTNSSPDFICNDGKRYEVKKLYATKIIFYETQIKKMEDSDYVLVFDNEKYIALFKWGERDTIEHIDIKTVKFDNTKVKIQIEEDLANDLIKLKKVGESYSDVIQKLYDFWKVKE